MNLKTRINNNVIRMLAVLTLVPVLALTAVMITAPKSAKAG